ncbi:hypothetical protein CTheo_4526 [Ceratobasidium theobromae]|uniref:Uncharacterized protein n=1 Tax=Ceratobasidium theobromae TaxID=1582974 RepID=A0A5N5QJS4_9AGAM|nr:hypothetical protein CTheo_4526 [Ceratobasidium theobromae]
MPMEYEWHGCGAGLKARAWIERPDGKELDTYFVDGDIENSWIASVEGQEFEVCWSAKFCTSDPQLRSLDLGATVWLDGVEVGAGVLGSASIIKGDYTSISGRFVATDMHIHKERLCQSGRSVSTDDDDQAHLILEELNTIRIELEWGWLYEAGQVDEPGDVEEIQGSIQEQEPKSGDHGSAILEDPDPVKVPSDPDELKIYGFRRRRSLDPTNWVAHCAPLAWLEAEGIVSKPRQGCKAAQDVANAGESELKPEPGPEPEPEPAPCTYLTGKRKRTCGLELTGSSDIKSESDSDNFGNLGEGDEIICVEHLVSISTSGIPRKKLRTSSSSDTTNEELDTESKL